MPANSDDFVDLKAFDNAHAYRAFAKIVQNERRWIFDGKVNAFLNAVRISSKAREGILRPGQEVWRCQRGARLHNRTIDEAEIDFHCPYSRKRMFPDARFGKAGRANPSGIAYFYVANNPETAMAEMRPSVGEHVTVGLFEVTRKLRVVVCGERNDAGSNILFDQHPSPAKLERCIWGEISEAFSRPVNADDQQIEYVPTQILAETFKDEGFDGVAYRSGLSKGTNLVLFKKHSAKFVKGYVYCLKGVRYNFTSEETAFTIVRKKNRGFECRDQITTQTP